MHFGPKLADSVLQAKPKRVRAVPIHEQQIVFAIAVDVQDLRGLHRARIRNFLRLSECPVGALREHI